MSVDEHRLLPDILQFGRVVKNSDHTLMLHFHNNITYRVVMKSTQPDDAMFLSSFHRSSDRDVRNTINKGQLIRDWPEKSKIK